MDFGDLIILIFIVTSLLSSIAGGKKKQQAKKRPQARSRPPQESLPDQRPEPVPTPPAREPDGAGTMEDILRQLGLDVGPQPQVEPQLEPAPPPAPIERELLRDRVEREIPQAASLEDESIDSVVERAGPEHEEFHERYVEAFEQTRIANPRSRARLLLNPRSLREAVILKEILGPPKGMQ